MPFINAGAPVPGMAGTLAHQVENMKNTYASPGPMMALAERPAFYRSGNAIAGLPLYGAVDATSGDQRGSALLSGDAGALI